MNSDCFHAADKEPGGEEAVGSLPQEADRGEPSGLSPTEGTLTFHSVIKVFLQLLQSMLLVLLDLGW